MTAGQQNRSMTTGWPITLFKSMFPGDPGDKKTIQSVAKRYRNGNINT